MVVCAWVSSKSSTWELVPFSSAAWSTSGRSGRPNSVALACPEKGRQGRHRIGHRLMLKTAQSAADPIEERAFGFMAHRLRHIREARQGDEPRQLPREVVREFRLLEYRDRGLRLCLRAYKRVADRRSRDGQSCRGAGSPVSDPGL